MNAIHHTISVMPISCNGQQEGLAAVGDSTQRQLDVVKLNAGLIKKLEADIAAHKTSAVVQKKLVHTLEKEREKHGAEASDMGARLLATVEEVTLREGAILDLQKKIGEGELRHKTQQVLKTIYIFIHIYIHIYTYIYIGVKRNRL